MRTCAMWSLSPLAWPQSPPQPAWAPWSLGSRPPASCRQLPRLPVCTSCPARPASVAEAWSRWNQCALPSFVCWCFLPFTVCFLFSGLSGPGESRGQPGSQPSTPGRPPARSRRLSLWGWRLSPPLPPPDPSTSGLVVSPSPSTGGGGGGAQSLLSEAQSLGGT